MVWGNCLQKLCIVLFLPICLGNVIPLDTPTTKLVFRDHTPTVFMMNPMSGKSDQEAIFQFHLAASAFYQSYPERSPQHTKIAQHRLLFVLSDPNDGLFTFQKLCHHLGIYSTNHQIVYLSHDQKYRYGHTHQLTNKLQITKQSLLQFIQLAQNNGLPLYYKSQEPKTINQPVLSVSANMLKGKIEASKEAIVLFYAPLCYRSMALEAQFHKAAEILENNSNIKFMQVDLSANEISFPMWESQDSPKYLLTAQQAPTIIYFKNNNKEIKQKYLHNTEINYSTMIDWIRTQTEYDWMIPIEVDEKITQEL